VITDLPPEASADARPGVPTSPERAPIRGTGPVARWQALPERRRGAILHGISLAIAFPLLLWIDRHQWFSGDEWDFLVRRGVVGHPELGLLQPHNEHWVTSPILLYRALFSVFGVRTYVPYLLVLVVAHLFVAHLLWRLLVRWGVDWLVAVGATAVFMVLGAGWENLLNAFQITFVAPLALGLLALLLAPETGPCTRRDLWASLVLVLALTFSGVGLTMTVVVGATALLRRGWKPGLLTVAAPAIVYLTWYAGWGRHATAVEQEPLGVALQKAPEFVWHGMVSAIDGVTGFAGIGPVIIVLLVCWLVRGRVPTREPWPPVLALFVGAPLFLFLVDIRRSALGVDSGAAPRYAYAVLALLVPAAALAATALLARTPMRPLVVVAATAVLCLVGVSGLNDAAKNYAPIKLENKARIVAAAALARSGAALVSDAPVPEFSPDLRVGALSRLARDGQLPGNVGIDETDRLDAAVFLQTSVGATAAPGTSGAAPATVERVEDAQLASSGGCAAVTPTGASPTLVLSSGHPHAVEVTTSRDGTLTTQLQTPDPGAGARSIVRTWPASGGVPQQVSSSATDRWLRLRVPADGTTRVCGIRSLVP
jgi:hypothetical protein